MENKKDQILRTAYSILNRITLKHYLFDILEREDLSVEDMVLVYENYGETTAVFLKNHRRNHPYIKAYFSKTASCSIVKYVSYGEKAGWIPVSDEILNSKLRQYKIDEI